MSVRYSTQPDSLDAIVQRLDGAVSKVSQLRLFLDDLETELSEIRQQCQNEIRVRVASVATTTKVQVDREGNKDTMNYNSHPGITHRTPLPVPDEIGTNKEQNREGEETDGRISEPKHIHNSVEGKLKGHSTSLFPVSSSGDISTTSSLGVAKREDWFPHCRPPKTEAGRVARRHIPNPFTLPSETINVSSFPPEFKRETLDGFVLFNPSPKVKRILDVNLIHTIISEARVICCKFSPDGNWLAVGAMDAEIYNVKTGFKTRILRHPAPIVDICFSPDGSYLATVSIDTHVRVWNIAKTEIQISFEGRQNVRFSSSSRFSPNGQFIALGLLNQSLCIWDIYGRTCKVLTVNDHYLPGNENRNNSNLQLSSQVFSPDGRYIAAGDVDAVVRIWDVTTGVLVQSLRGHKGNINCIAFTPDGKGLISGSDDEMLKYWDISGLVMGTRGATTPCLRNLASYEHQALWAAVSHDSRWLVTQAGYFPGHRGALFWDMRTGVVECMLSGPFSPGIDMSPVKNLMATISICRGKVRIWSY